MYYNVMYIETGAHDPEPTTRGRARGAGRFHPESESSFIPPTPPLLARHHDAAAFPLLDHPRLEHHATRKPLHKNGMDRATQRAPTCHLKYHAAERGDVVLLLLGERAARLGGGRGEVEPSRAAARRRRRRRRLGRDLFTEGAILPRHVP